MLLWMKFIIKFIAISVKFILQAMNQGLIRGGGEGGGVNRVTSHPPLKL